MKIAVCDDDIAELNNICEILNNYFEEKKYDIYISKFGSSVELASIIQKEKFVYFVNSFATSFLFFSMPISVTLHQTILRMF